ncbi:4Fe-4S dicluster domain-containing protein [bacterium]|nr:4Fe-4S dicluster domain-containing protein [bacterium]
MKKRQLMFSFNIQDCSGCMACVVACQDQNDIKADGTALRQVSRQEKGVYPTLIANLSLSCMHCGDAPCLLVCPTGAIFKHAESGAIDINRDICIGCHSCELACYFGAPKFADDGKMIKCDLCIVRIENGLKPACVHTCTTGALQLGYADDLVEKKVDGASRKFLNSFLDQHLTVQDR